VAEVSYSSIPIALRSASSTSRIMMGRDHPSRRPSSTRATYSFIDQPRLAAASLSQLVSRYARRKETMLSRH